jgi:dTDP-4-amino-4,6-dideoxygalactose transaminase
MNWKIPLFELELGEEEIKAVETVMRSRWLTMGEKIQEFERDFASFIGAKHAFALSNATAALHLSNMALGIGPGDEVIVPSLTFVATANAIRYVGAKPVFAEVVSENDWTISPADIERRITPRTRAISVVHYAGYGCDMEAIRTIATRHKLAIIEDCAHSPGATLAGKALGAWGDAGCFSFFSNKNMTTGEGGMLVTDRDDIAAAVRGLRSHGMTTMTLDRHKGHAFVYDVTALGYNYRMTEMHAAMGIEQLKRLPRWNEQRADVVRCYREALIRVPGITVPFAGHRGKSTYHIMPVLLPAGTVRQSVMEALKAAGIQTSVHYRPIHTFSAYENEAAKGLALTESIGTRALTLPLYPSMTRSQVEMVADALRAALAG